jgi:hypothetical protein
VNADGTVSIWAVTSTVSGGGDQGADPNQLMSVTDNLAATTQPSGETFQSVLAPANQTVVRGVTFTPGSAPVQATPEVPWAPHGTRARRRGMDGWASALQSSSGATRRPISVSAPDHAKS